MTSKLISRQNIRFFNQIRRFSSKTPICEEIRIPFEWGPIAGKLWGSPDKRPILALHGWQDNCGTFDTLIPLLRDDMSFLALDLPGHGRSAHFPSGLGGGNGLDYVNIIRRLQKYFGWDKVSFMCHSLGAIASYIYAMHYPKEIDFMVLFDAITPFKMPKMLERRAQGIDYMLRYEELRLEEEGRPSYTMDALVKLLHEGSEESVDLDKCMYILERNTVPVPDNPSKYYLTRDIRLKVAPLYLLPEDEIVEASEYMNFPVCLFKAGEKSLLDKKNHKQSFCKVWSNIMKGSKDAQLVLVEGKHHFHLNNPERIADTVNDFVGKYYEGGVHLPEQLQKLRTAAN